MFRYLTMNALARRSKSIGEGKILLLPGTAVKSAANLLKNRTGWKSKKPFAQPRRENIALTGFAKEGIACKIYI